MNSTRNRDKPCIGIYCPGIGFGAQWRYIHSIMAGMDPDEFEVTVFCDLTGIYEPLPWVKVVTLRETAQPSNKEVVAERSAPVATVKARPKATRYLPVGARLWAGFAKESRRIARRFQAHPVELLHTQCTGCEESPAAARLAGIRRVLGTFHVDSTYDLHGLRSGPGHRLMETISNRCLDAAIAVSHATKRDWVRRTHIPSGRVVTIHNGIDPEKFRRRQSREEARRQLGVPANALVVGGLGRLEEAKGFADLIEAVPQLLAEFPELKVLIAGTGPIREHLEAQAVRLGVSSAIRFMGFLPDVQRLLDSLDVFAFPSLCETLGYALLEAMATEVPAVGSMTGGIPEVIVHGETGLVVPARSPDQFGAGIATLLKSADLRRKFGESGRERVIQSFNERDMVANTIRLYRWLCGRGKARTPEIS